MKQISLLCYVFMASLCLVLTSCGKDDYDDDQLIGTWQANSESGYYYEDGDKKEYNDTYGTGDDDIYITFNQNGTGEYYGDEGNYSFKWSLNGKKKRVTIQADGETIVWSVTISTNSSSPDVLIIEEKGKDEDGYDYYRKINFVAVNL